jgi:hypothetical protein
MEVEYELTFDDIKAGLAENISNNLKAKRRFTFIRILYIVSGILLIGASFVLAPHNTDYALFAGMFGAFFLVYGLLYRVWIRWILLRVSLRKDRDKSNAVVVKHKFSLAREFITIDTDNGQAKVRWRSIEKITSNNDYLFLLVRGPKLYVVPRRAFADNEAFSRFIETAKRYQEKAK